MIYGSWFCTQSTGYFWGKFKKKGKIVAPMYEPLPQPVFESYNHYFYEIHCEEVAVPPEFVV
jgi:hypothetical protein